MDCLESIIQLQSPGLQKIVPASPGFWLDYVVIPDRLQSDANFWTIVEGLLAIRGFPMILLQFFRFSGNPLWFCNLVAIQLDCTGSRMDCLERIRYNHSPQDCKRLCRHRQGFGNLVAIHFDRTDCDQNRGNPGLIEGIWLQFVSIVSGLHPICNQGAIVRFVNRRFGFWQDCNGPLSVFQDTSRTQSRFCDIWSNQSTIRFDCVWIP